MVRTWSSFFLVALALWTVGCGRLDSLTQFGVGNEANPLAFSAIDVRERPVSVGIPSERVQILFFSAPATSDAMQPVTAEIAVEFNEADDLEFVTVVDLRSLSFYERPFADGAISDAGQRTINRINRQLTERGLPEVENMWDHLYLVSDVNGEITQQYGVADPNSVLTCIVFDKFGQELGRYQPETQLADIVAAIEAGQGSAEEAAE